MSWFAYAALAAGLVPVVLMAIGYIFVSYKERRVEREANRRVDGHGADRRCADRRGADEGAPS